MSLLVKAIDIVAGYDGEIILPGVSFEIASNDFIGIIGPNGGGKTTLIKVLLGMIKPFSGKVLYGEKESPFPPFEIGYLPQQNSIDKQFPISVYDVVSSGLVKNWNKGTKGISDVRNKVENMLERVHMSAYRDTHIGKLSGGQLQRILLARALVSSPSLLILDEPNTYVDKRFEGHLYSLLPEINKETAIMVISHDVGSVQKLVRTIFCVDRDLHIHHDVQSLAGNPTDHTIV
ncbi:MAG: ATP-binding cassette domain-containing protein [Porphyromonas sp.]|nr:ATP-binding cassette domain-containing protein [Porphyromonas sp.]